MVNDSVYALTGGLIVPTLDHEARSRLSNPLA